VGEGFGWDELGFMYEGYDGGVELRLVGVGVGYW
jgi:hypothetical protein